MTYYDPMYKFSTLTLTNQALQNMLDTNKQYNEFIEKKKEESLNEIKKKKTEQIADLESKLNIIEKEFRSNVCLYFENECICGLFPNGESKLERYADAKINDLNLKHEWKKIKKQLDNIKSNYDA